MNNQNIQLEIGDEIGFAQIKNDIDSIDNVIFFPVIEITSRDGERAYRYLYPDGQISSAAIPQSRLSSYVLRINRAVEIAPATSRKICLNERKDEFKAALKRGLDNDLVVYAGWDKDTFFVRNDEKGTEYKVELETVENRIFAECECKDFFYKKRTCKHIGEVLQEQFFGVSLKA